mgnify:CR=1 FL=1
MREGETLNYSESQLKDELAVVDVTDPKILRDLADTLLNAAAWMEKNK